MVRTATPSLTVQIAAPALEEWVVDLEVKVKLAGYTARAAEANECYGRIQDIDETWGTVTWESTIRYTEADGHIRFPDILTARYDIWGNIVGNKYRVLAGDVETATEAASFIWIEQTTWSQEAQTPALGGGYRPRVLKVPMSVNKSVKKVGREWMREIPILYG